MAHITHARQNNYHVKIPPKWKEVPCQYHCFPYLPRLQNAVLNMAPCGWYDGTQKIHSKATKINKEREGRGSPIMLGFKLNLGSPIFFSRKEVVLLLPCSKHSE